MAGFVELNRKDGSRIYIRTDEILSIVDEPDATVVRLKNGSFQIVKQTYDEVLKKMNDNE